MKWAWIKDLGFFLVLLLAQVLICNHVHLFDCATPLLYVYFVLPVRRNSAKWATLLWCFALGLCVDTFTNTPGVAAASMTLVALVQPYLLELFVPRDSADDLEPSYKTLGTTKYLFYTFVIVALYCLVFFTLEVFTFTNWVQWALCVGGSMVLTIALIGVIETLRTRQ